MSNYAGLDIGLEQTAVCIMDQEGTILRDAMVTSDPDALSELLIGTGFPLHRIGMEACQLSQWLFDGLVKAGLPAICIEIRHLKAAMSAMIHKSDHNDARGIAQVMRTGWFRAVHVKSRGSQEIRMLLTSRRFLVSKRGALESELRGSLKVFGLKVGKVAPGAFAARIREVAGVRDAIEAQGAKLEYLPPYSPDLHPIEQVFAKLKHFLRKTGARTVEALHDAIAETLDRFHPDECRNYIQNSGYST